MLPTSSFSRRAVIYLAFSLFVLFLLGSLALWGITFIPHAWTRPYDNAIANFLHGDRNEVVPNGALLSIFFAIHGLIAGALAAATRRDNDSARAEGLA